MDLNIKAKLRPVAELVRGRSNFSVDLDIAMLEHAGSKVTITDLNEDDNVLSIKEDNGEHCWDREMFVGNLKELPDSVDVNLKQCLDDNSYGRVHFNGNVGVGCAEVLFSDLENLYKASLEQRKKYASLLPKRKKRKAKKKK